MKGRCGATVAVVLLCWFGFAPRVLAQHALNDTGSTTCYDDTVATADEPPTHPRQDCRLGRDAANGSGALAKSGAGAEGFDFTKISNAGTALPASAPLGTEPTDWACTYDNVTGLMWEVKSPTSGTLRASDATYSWYNTNASTNGGDPGLPDWGWCSGGIQCDTQSFVAAVNGAGLCGHTNWRMPTTQEIQTLVDFNIFYDQGPPAIDGNYFPGTQVSPPYWTATNLAASPAYAYYMYFNGGYTVAGDKQDDFCVMLVRSGL